MFITAAITGAVMQDADPLQSKFIPQDYLDNFVSDTERNTLSEALTSDGWKPVAKGGLRIRLKTQGIIDEDSLSSLSSEESSKAEDWLAENKWQKEGNIWRGPDSKLTNIPTITTAMLEAIESTDIQRKVVMELTSQGWQADGEGNLSWHYTQGESYLPPELLTQNFITALQASGWENCGIGYKKEYNATSPYLPIFPQDIIHNAHASAREGAAIVHLHTRDLESKAGYTIPGLPVDSRNIIGNNIIDTEQYEKITPTLLDNDPSLVLNFSTSMRGNPLEQAQRRAHLTGYGARNLPPDIASFSPGDVIFQAGGGYANSPDFIIAQAAHMKEKGIRPEIEVFNHTIATNACEPYRNTIRDLGIPPLFMLVPVDQYRTKPTRENPSPADDSLIPVDVRKQITQYIKEGEVSEAKSLAVKHLKPVVEQIKSAHPDAIVSLLMPGAMQSIITDVAVELGLDGIRVGLEDSLNITDEHIAGGMRKATNAEQVQRIREELTAKGILIETPEALRKRLGMDREEVKLFREMETLLAPLAECLPDRSKLPTASDILEILDPIKERYMQIEARFTQDVLSHVNAEQTPEKMAEIIWDTARKHRMGIRFFMEESERYENPEAFSLRDVHTLQPLNFMREVLHEQGQESALFDTALEKFQGTGTSKIIPPSQFKDSDTRFLDFAAFIPVIYNQDRTAITNTGLREDEHYSATMAILLTALEEKMLALREKANVPAKKSTILWQKLQAPEERSFSDPSKCEFVPLSSEELSNTLSASSWIVLPSTPATNHPSGIVASNGLAQTLRGFIHNAIGAYKETGNLTKPSP